jgi:hypothetical protein
MRLEFPATVVVSPPQFRLGSGLGGTGGIRTSSEGNLRFAGDCRNRWIQGSELV